MTPITYLPTVATFADRYGVTISWEEVESNPLLTTVVLDAKHFEVTLRRNRKRMTTPFTLTKDQGTRPEVLTVLTALGVESATYEANKDWMRESDIDTQRVLTLLATQADKLRNFLDSPAYEELIQISTREINYGEADDGE